MAGTRIYGQLIRAQLELLASNPSSATGMMYFHTGDSLVTVYDGTGWRKLVTSASIADLSILPIITPAKGGLGADASAWTGVIKAASGVFSAATIVNTDISATAAIDYSKLSVPDAAIPQAKVADLVTDLGNKVDANAAITGDTKTKITYDSKGLVTSGDDLTSDDIPSTLLEKVVSSTAATTGALKLPIGNSTTERPTGTAAQLKGMVRYNDTDDVFEGYNEVGGWSSIGGGGTTDRITQASHGFVVGDVLYLNGSTYAKARADAANTAEVVGVVSKIIDASQFELTLSGEISGLTGLVAGEVYFLSPTTAGALTVTEPTVVGQVSLPVGVASSTTSLYVAPKRGAVVGSSNARTQIALANNATTTVQNISAYDAGELTGWVSITATTPLRFYVAAQFSKNGAANNFNVSYQVSGDTPPTGFSVTATAAGLLQVTLPSVTGFASASINYALNAPAVGTSFPLSIDAGSITTGTFIRGSFSSGIETKGAVEVGFGRSSDGAAYVDLISQASESDFNARLIRYSGISGDLELNNSSGLVKFSITGVTKASVNSIGNFALDGLTHGSSYGCLTAKGIQGRQGTSGSSAGNPYNFFWSGSVLQAWVDGTNIGNVTISSDYRAKKNIETQNLTAIDRVMALRPVKYEFADYKELFKADGIEREGFIAHEVAAVIPSAVDGEKDAEDQVQSLKLDALVSVLTKAIQELKTELDSVKSELEALKNK